MFTLSAIVIIQQTCQMMSFQFISSDKDLSSLKDFIYRILKVNYLAHHGRYQNLFLVAAANPYREETVGVDQAHVHEGPTIIE